jgi:hypothetical protein
MKPVEVRSELSDALKLDLVGPNDRLGSLTEILPQAPSRWYLTGFLVPFDAEPQQRADEDSTEEVDAASDAGGADDATTPEPASARQKYLPSSIGLSVLVSASTQKLKVMVRWADYKLRTPSDGHGGQEKWERAQRAEEVLLDVPAETKQPLEKEVKDSGGLKIALSVRRVTSDGADVLVELGAESFDERIELPPGQHLVELGVERMSRRLRQFAGRDEQGLLIDRFAFSHGHERSSVTNWTQGSARSKRFQWISPVLKIKTTGC